MGWERRRERGKGANREIRERNGGIFNERGSNFSLNFPAIRLSVSDEVRSKVAPHGEGYTWVPVLWSFDNSMR